MLRSPVKSAEQKRLEQAGPDRILQAFQLCLEKGRGHPAYSHLPRAWGTLFQYYYLTAEEMLECMREGIHRIETADEEMLREFIRADCKNNGPFVPEVIRIGGKIDRIALIQIADFRDLAQRNLSGSTALHVFTAACDPDIRPYLISMAGRRLISNTRDSWGIPLLFSILSLGDLKREDLNAILRAFSREDLATVTSGTGTGKNGLEVFLEVEAGIQRRVAKARNAFEIPQAIRTTNLSGELKNQVKKQSSQKQGSSSATAESGNKDEEELDDRTKEIDRYEELLAFPLIGDRPMTRKGREAPPGKYIK